MTPREMALAKFAAWSNRFTRPGGIGGGLIVLEHLKEDYNLSLDSHKTPGGAQIRAPMVRQLHASWRRPANLRLPVRLLMNRLRAVLQLNL